MKIYTTVQGDMWDAIAYRTMGSTRYTDLLMRANQEHLGCFTFPAGIVLTVPEIPKDSGIPDSLPPWLR